LKFKGPCEYNPKEKRACFGDEIHAEADFIVGYNGKWRLCKYCANLPEFKGFKKKLIKEK